MANPVSNHLVSGKITDRFGNIIVGATVTLTHKSIDPVLSKTTDSNGEYIFNLSKLDTEWTVGQNITLFSITQFEGRKSTTVPISSGPSQTVNLTMEETSDLSFAETDTTQRHNLVFALPVTYDGRKVTKDNPLPVNILALIQNISFPILTYDSSDNLLTVDQLLDDTTYRLTLTYDSSDNIASVSRWVRQ